MSRRADPLRTGLDPSRPHHGPPAQNPRAPEFAGHLFLHGAARASGRTVLARQAFRAPYHISKPYWDPDARTLLIQVVNPTAGILAGDRLESDIAVDDSAALLVTTPSASRVFQMRGGKAECRQRFVVSRGAWLEVMPEPLVPHRGSDYRQVTHVEVERGGGLYFADQLMPGRTGHGEAWEWSRLQLELDVAVAGERVLRERLNQTGAELRALAEWGGSGYADCFANAVLIAPDGWNPDPDPPWRADVDALHRDGVRVGVSALRHGGWSIRLIARDAVRLRETMRNLRGILARYFPRLACDPRKL